MLKTTLLLIFNTYNTFYSPENITTFFFFLIHFKTLIFYLITRRITVGYFCEKLAESIIRNV